MISDRYKIIRIVSREQNKQNLQFGGLGGMGGLAYPGWRRGPENSFV